ncbi:MAG: lipoyl(octanoyl) transferase LipB [Candidatus Thermoplasmatota archaeon]|nr:lipoyl(octanoyl) transferase LipB [Candidatus Thermoplasmatota archaeon]
MITLLNCIPMDYGKCLVMQREMNEIRNEGRIGDTIIATEHNDTYTGGIHFNGENAGNYSVSILRVERGGNLTYHGKGQLVLYFIINLKDRGINVKDLIEKVQTALNETLLTYGLKGEGRMYKETGVWVENRKICSIGFAVKGFSTLHGIAVNLNTDLSKFFNISPCDLDPGVMTSLAKEIGHPVDEREFLERMTQNLSRVFGEEIQVRDCKSIKN